MVFGRQGLESTVIFDLTFAVRSGKGSGVRDRGAGIRWQGRKRSPFEVRAFPGPRIRISTPRTKTCPWGPRGPGAPGYLRWGQLPVLLRDFSSETQGRDP